MDFFCQNCGQNTGHGFGAKRCVFKRVNTVHLKARLQHASHPPDCGRARSFRGPPRLPTLTSRRRLTRRSLPPLTSFLLRFLLLPPPLFLRQPQQRRRLLQTRLSRRSHPLTHIRIRRRRLLLHRPQQQSHRIVLSFTEFQKIWPKTSFISFASASPRAHQRTHGITHMFALDLCHALQK